MFKSNHIKFWHKRTAYTLCLALQASYFKGWKTLKTGFEDIPPNSPERRSVDVFDKFLRLPGHRPVGSHFLLAGGPSVTQ